MIVEVANAEGVVLDWMVAQCVEADDGMRTALGIFTTRTGKFKHPSTKWAEGGPIMEREISDLNKDGGRWQAVVYGPTGDFIPGKVGHCAFGPTALIAAMRCYVASKLGDEVDVPDNFCGGNHAQRSADD